MSAAAYNIEGFVKYLATPGESKTPLVIERAEDSTEVEISPFNAIIPPGLRVRI